MEYNPPSFLSIMDRLETSLNTPVMVPTHDTNVFTHEEMHPVHHKMDTTVFEPPKLPLPPPPPPPPAPPDIHCVICQKELMTQKDPWSDITVCLSATSHTKLSDFVIDFLCLSQNFDFTVSLYGLGKHCSVVKEH